MVKEGDIEYGQGEAGLPDPCPSCGTLGYLQHINLRTATKTQRCPRCGRVWSAELSLREHAAAAEPRKWTLKQLGERSSSAASQAAAGVQDRASPASPEPSESEPGWLVRIRAALRKPPRTATQRAMWVDLQRLLRERDLLLKRADEATKFVIAELERADDDEQPRA